MGAFYPTSAPYTARRGGLPLSGATKEAKRSDYQRSERTKNHRRPIDVSLRCGIRGERLLCFASFSAVIFRFLLCASRWMFSHFSASRRPFGSATATLSFFYTYAFCTSYCSHLLSTRSRSRSLMLFLVGSGWVCACFNFFNQLFNGAPVTLSTN